MRRKRLSALVAALAAAGLLVAGTASGGAAAPAEPDAVGWQIEDPAPVAQEAPVTLAAAEGEVACDGDGTSGKRAQLVYVRETADADRLADFRATFQQFATQIDEAFIEAATATGGYRRVRWVHDRYCKPTVSSLVVPNGELNAFEPLVSALKAAGYNRTDRKYVVFAETTAWCGLAGGGNGANDDRPGAENRYNVGPDMATMGSGCWRWATAAHELLHTLGAVVPTAPHASAYGHCYDDEDIMCYNDGGIPNPPGGIVKVCTGGPVDYIDCGNDDYFNVTPPAGSWLASHWNVANSQFLLTSERVDPAPAAGRFTALATPVGVLDTRDGTGATAGKRGAGSTTVFPVSGVGGIPASGVSAVQVRVAVGSATAATFLEVWPEGRPSSGLSTIGVGAGENISNVAVVPVGASGKLAVFNAYGSADLMIDVEGYYRASGGGFVPVTHTRLVDTRSGLGTATGTIPSGGSRTITLTGSVVPAGATAAAVNLLVPGASAGGWLAAAPTGTASGRGVLNYVTGATQSGATVKLSSSGQVTFSNKGSAAIHLVVAAQGYYTGTAGAALTPSPARIVNTRLTGTPLAAGATLDVPVAGVSGIPADVSALAMNLTVTSPEQAGYLQAWPVGASPTVSIMDFNAGVWRANGLVLTPGTGGAIRVKNGSSGTIHVIVDVHGWYAP